MIEITTRLLENLIAEQFPDWAGLPLRPADNSGWDNRSFRLGEDYLVRLPSAAAYAGQVAKEQEWLPVLAPHVPVAIPKPVAKGEPGQGYPYHWSVYRWLPGRPAASARIADRIQFAGQLAAFLRAFQRIDVAGAPPPGDENFHRGGPLTVYDAEAREAIDRLGPDVNKAKALSIWERGARTTWNGPPVWVHGDFAAGNLLIDDGRLSAVIDFGQLCAGDPACDFVIAWTFLSETERDVFRDALEPDEEAWLRGRCWALWKAALVVSGMANSNAVEMAAAPETLRRVLAS